MNRLARPRRPRRRAVTDHLLATITALAWFSALAAHAQALNPDPRWFARGIIVAGGLCLTTWACVYARPPRWPRWRTLAAVAVTSAVGGGLIDMAWPGSGPAAGLGIGFAVLIACTPRLPAALLHALRAPGRAARGLVATRQDR
jgi:hypothetical protein